MKNIKLILALLVSLVVTACGGGGDNGLGNSSINMPLDITANNALAVTAATLNTMSGSAINAFSPDDFLAALNNTPCINGGSISYLPSSVTAGSLHFSNCGFVANKSYNGTVAFSNLTTTPAGSLNPTDASSTFNFNLTVSRTGFSPLTLLGDYHLSATGLYLAPTTTINTTGTSLQLTSNITEIISNFSFGSILLNNISSTDTNNFDLASSILGGRISCQTTTPFVTNLALNSRFPSAGVVIVSSTFNANRLRITILGDETSVNQVQVQLDTGIGFGSPVLYTWNQVFP